MLFTSFTFPNGKIAKNRIFKSAMEEQLAQNDQPSEKLVRLYDTWAQGGAGVLVTGNVMVAESGKGSINDVVISDGRSLEMLKKWAKAGTQNDTLLIMQINHAGKQSPAVVNKTPLAPSAVPLVGMDGFINPPRELTADEIIGLIQQFVQTAKIAEQAGFSGVQFTPRTAISSANSSHRTTTAAKTNGAAVWKTVCASFWKSTLPFEPLWARISWWA